MNTEQKFSIQIEAVANGYIVTGAYDMRQDQRHEPREPHVFESFESLKQWLNAYLPIYPVYLNSAPQITATAKRKR